MEEPSLSDHPFLRLTRFRQRLGLLKWLIPAGLMLLVMGYYLGPARWLYDGLGFTYNILADLLIFGTVGPALAFVLLYFLERWLEERDTSDLQAQILAQAREDAQKSRQLNDDALQILFAAGTLIDSLKSSHPDLPPETAVKIEAMEQALDQAMQQLRAHLLK